MKAMILALGLIVTASSALAQTHLPWTTSADSVQAVVYEVLVKYKQMDENSQYPQGYIQTGKNGELIVEDGSNYLVCDSASFGMTPVQSYQCEFSSTELGWTVNSLSVQAILFAALSQMRHLDIYPSHYIHATEDGALFVQDENLSLVCDSDSFGMTPVQSYQCSIGE